MRVPIPSTTRRTLRRAIVACMALGLLLGHSCSDITTSTLLCEDAASRIYQCCSVHAAIDCHENGCSGHHPNFPPETAKCLRSLSCDDLRAAGVCDVLDWQFPIGSTCYDGQATCPGDAGTCAPTIIQACAAVGRLTCR